MEARAVGAQQFLWHGLRQFAGPCAESYHVCRLPEQAFEQSCQGGDVIPPGTRTIRSPQMLLSTFMEAECSEVWPQAWRATYGGTPLWPNQKGAPAGLPSKVPSSQPSTTLRPTGLILVKS